MAKKSDREIIRIRKAQELQDKQFADTEADRLAALQDVYKSVNKDLKGNVLIKTDQLVTTAHIRRPSGIMQLDIDTAGGLPPGISVISGPEGVGKSRLALAYMRMNQRIYGDKSVILYIPTEFAPSLLYLRKAGVVVALPDRLIEHIDATRQAHGLAGVTDEEVIEWKRQIGSFELMPYTDASTVLETVLKVMQTNAAQLIVLDSIAMLSTSDQQTKEIEEANKIGTHAAAVTQFIHKVHPIQLGVFGLNETTFIAIDQVRAAKQKPGVPVHMQKEYEAKGAHALKHGKLFEVQVKKGEFIRHNGEKVGKMVRWELSKGKAGAHEGVSGDTAYFYENEWALTGAGFDETTTVIDAGLKYGAIADQGTKKAPGPFVLVNGYTGEMTDNVFPSLKELREKIEADVDFELYLRENILIMNKIEVLYGRM